MEDWCFLRRLHEVRWSEKKTERHIVDSGDDSLQIWEIQAELMCVRLK